MEKLNEKQVWLYIAKLFKNSKNGSIRGEWTGVCDQIALLYYSKLAISYHTYFLMIAKVDSWKPYSNKYTMFKAPRNAEGAKWRTKMCRKEARKLNE